jgi:hypothetical protein
MDHTYSYSIIVSVVTRLGAGQSRVQIPVQAPNLLIMDHTHSYSIIGSVVTRLVAGQSGVQIPVHARNLVLLHHVHTGSGAHPAPYSMGTGVFSRG